MAGRPARTTALLAALIAAGCGGAPRSEMAPADPVPRQAVPPMKPAPPPADDGRADGIAARINDEIVTWKDVADSLSGVRAKDMTPELRREGLRKLAEERLFLQAARSNRIEVSERELDEIKRREEKAYGGEEELEKVIRIKWGTKQAYREDRRKDRLIQKLLSHLVQKSFSNPDGTTPELRLDFASPEEIRAYYEEHPDQFKAIERASFWRIGLQFSTDEEKALKRAMAESVLRRLGEGTEFSMMAFFYSDVPRARGFRDVGVTREDALAFYAPETVALIFDTMKEGDISPIVEDGKSLNVFRLEQKIDQKEESFESAQLRIRQFLESQRRGENRRHLRDHLLRQAYVWPPDLFSDP